MTVNDLLQFSNLVLIPILVYVMKFERKLAILETTRDEIYRRLERLDDEILAVHRRLDHLHIPHASDAHP